jgi:hypothetical protein
VSGFFVGETSTAVYLAPNRNCYVRDRIVVLPREQVTKLVIWRSTEVWTASSHPRRCPSPLAADR